MRALIVVLMVFSFGLNFVSAQKFGYIDSDFILSKMTEYKKAQGEIDQLSAGWQKEIEDMDTRVQALYAAFKAEEVLLTEEMRLERQTEIKKKETELKE